MRLFFEISLTIILVTLLGCTTTIKAPKQAKNVYPQTVSEIKNIESKIDKAYYSFLGTFFNRNEVDTFTSPFSKGQILRSVPIWNKKGEPYWFAMAWYSLDKPEVPLAIGIFQIEKHVVDTFKLNYYDIPKSAIVSEIWTNEDFLSEYKPSDLVLNEGCSDLLVYEGNNSFKVINDSIYCHASITNQLELFDLNLSLDPEKQVHTNKLYTDNEAASVSKVGYNRVLQLGD